MLVRRQNAVEKSSFYVEVVHVQVELVSDGKESANSGRFRHWGVYIVGVKVQTFCLTESEDAAAGFEFINAAIAADFYLEHKLSRDDFPAVRRGAHLECLFFNYLAHFGVNCGEPFFVFW